MNAIETLFAQSLALEGCPAPEYDVPIIPGRRFRWDFVYPDRLICIEIQGGTWVANTGHTSGSGLQRDMIKNNLAVLYGWTPYQFTTRQVNGGVAAKFIKEVLNGSKEEAGKLLCGRA